MEKELKTTFSVRFRQFNRSEMSLRSWSVCARAIVTGGPTS